MIKSAHKKHHKELVPATASKQVNEISELSVSLSESQPSEGCWEGKVGLLECLMSSESAEIQRLSSQVRLLTSRNHYLQKDKELLQNHISYLNERIAQLNKNSSLNKPSVSVNESLKIVMSQHLEAFERIITERLKNVLQKQINLEKTIEELRDKLSKDKAKPKQSLLLRQKMWKLEIQNKRLKVRVSQLQTSIQKLGVKYIQSFEWRPYLIPQFKHEQEATSRTLRDGLKLDLKRFTQSQIIEKTSPLA